MFLSLSYATVYLIYMRFRSTSTAEHDTFRLEFLLIPVVGLSFLENYAFTPLEVPPLVTSGDHRLARLFQRRHTRIQIIFIVHCTVGTGNMETQDIHPPTGKWAFNLVPCPILPALFTWEDV